MAGHDSKADLSGMISAHFKSFRNDASGRVRWQDHFLFDVIPIAAAAGTGLANVHLARGTSVGLLTTAGILSAFLFGLMVEMLDRASTWADSEPPQGAATSWHAQYLEELAANAGYASLVSVVTAIVFIVASTSSHSTLRLFSAIGVGIGLHLVLTLFMVMKRVFSLTQERLRIARTGAAQERVA